MQSSETLHELSVLDRDLIEQRIETLLKLREAGDIAAMAAYAAPEIVYRTSPGRPYPFHSRRDGKAECVELGIAINVAYENLGSTINHLLIDGDRVALHRTAKVRNRGAGRVIEIDIWNFFKFRDGLIVEFSEYPDTATLALLDSDLA